jgi:hypothetical protein
MPRAAFRGRVSLTQRFPIDLDWLRRDYGRSLT